MTVRPAFPGGSVAPRRLTPRAQTRPACVGDEGGDDEEDGGLEKGHQNDEQDHPGKGQDHVHKAHDDFIDPASEISGDQTESHPNQEGEPNHDNPYFKGGPCSPDNAVIDIILAAGGAETLPCA